MIPERAGPDPEDPGLCAQVLGCTDRGADWERGLETRGEAGYLPHVTGEDRTTRGHRAREQVQGPVHATHLRRLSMLRNPSFHALGLFVCGTLMTLTSCASSKASSPNADTVTGHPIRVRYVTYSGKGQDLELVNRSHTDPNKLYSEARPIELAKTKVQTDEVMEATLEYFRTKGFFEKAESGAAPATSEGVYSQSLEVETPERHVHWSVHKGLSPADRSAFTELASAFVQIYNGTIQLQAVDQPPAWTAPSQSGKKKGVEIPGSPPKGKVQ